MPVNWASAVAAYSACLVQRVAQPGEEASLKRRRRGSGSAAPAIGSDQSDIDAGDPWTQTTIWTGR